MIGARPIVDTPHFSRTKKALQLVGSMVVRMASRTQVVDAPSGFRALSRAAAERLHVHGEYTYTLETIIAAGQSKMAVTSVPIRTNPDLRPSRLVKSVPGYVLRSAITILRSFATYRPLRFFCGIGLVLFAAGCVLAVRYLYFVALGDGDGHVQSVIVSALLIGMGVFTGLIGVVADLIAVNRELLEKLLARERSHGHAMRRPGPSAAARPRPRWRKAAQLLGSDAMATPLPAAPALAGGNHYPKYTVRNPVARRLVDGFLAALAELARRSGARLVHEIGCGEGFLSTMLAQRGFAVRGSDLSPSAVAIARAPRRRSGPARELPRRRSVRADARARRRRAGGVLRGPGASRRPGPRAWRARPSGPAAPDRQRAARAAVAHAQHGALPLLAGARQHARASAALVHAQLSRAARTPGGGPRGAHAAALDHGALPPPLRLEGRGAPPALLDPRPARPAVL